MRPWLRRRHGAANSPTQHNQSASGSINFCNGNIVCFSTLFNFNSRNQIALSEVKLMDKLKDSRAVYADFTDNNGFLAEARNTKGAGTTSEWPLIVLDDPYGMKYFLVNIYACSTTCSSIKPSNRYYSDWW